PRFDGSRTLPPPCSRTSAWLLRNRWRRSSMSAEGQVSADERARMVEWQLRRRGIEDERVLAAMGRVPRELFVPPHLRDGAYADAALPSAETRRSRSRTWSRSSASSSRYGVVLEAPSAKPTAPG